MIPRAVLCRRAARHLAVAALAGIAAVAALGPAACRRMPPFRYDFEREDDLDELGWTCRTLFRLSDRFATSGSRSLEVEFFPDRTGSGESYPGLTLHRFDEDWSRRRTLALEVFNPEPRSLGLTVRIDDREHPEYPERYNARHAVAPGRNRIRIPLASLVTSGSRRALDLHSVRAVYFFLANPTERHVLLFDNLRLE